MNPHNCSTVKKKKKWLCGIWISLPFLKLSNLLLCHEAKRRQVQYIGKLMRHADADAIGAQLRELRQDSKSAVKLMHECERWRERLIEDDNALTELADRYPNIDMQPLRALIRNARREQAAGKASKSARQLYRSLHATLSEHQENS